MDHQDWTPIIVTRSASKSMAAVAATKAPKKIQERDGAQRSAAAHAGKLDNADAPVKIKILSHESRQELIKARVAAGKTQIQLNQACSFPANFIREVEAGRATPTGQHLNKLNAILRISLHLG